MDQAVVLLKEQIGELESLKHPPAYNPEYKVWEDTIRRILREYFDEDTVKLYTKSVGAVRIAMNQADLFNMYLEKLENKKGLLEGIIKQRERFSSSNNLDISKTTPISDYDLHSEIKIFSLKLFEDKHYAQAVEEAFKRVIQEVKTTVRVLTGEILDGDKLMNRAFGCEGQEPIIKFNLLEGGEDIDEQKGFMYLFKGIVGIRNKKAHTNVILNDPIRAIEYLSLASLLMRLLDAFASSMKNE